MSIRSGVHRVLAQERIHFGVRACDAVRSEVALRGAKRVFVVTSRSLNRKTDAVTTALSLVADSVVAVFDECVEHTPRGSVVELARQVRGSGADLIVTVGGGTAIDTVKVALVCLAQGVTTIEQLDDWHVRVDAQGRRVVPLVGLPPLRQIAVPTTLSAAEFSDLGGCTDTRSGVKQAFTGSHIGAAAVILDPAITLHTPARLWLSTGVRAIDHAVESLCSINAYALIDAACIRALALLAKSLRAYAQDPSDLDGRADAQTGAWLASGGINRTDYGASHGLGHVLGADSGVPHGITSCVLLPAVMRYNAAECAGPLREIAQALGDPARPAADQLEALIRGLGLPTRIGELGIERSRIPALAQKAMANQWVRTNPRKIADAAQAAEILERAW